MACCKKGNGASKHLDYFAVATVIGTIIVTGVVLTGFWTSSWVVVDPEKYPASVPSFNIFFHKLGLWEICLRLYRPGSPYAYQKFSMMCESVISTTNQNFHAPGNFFHSVPRYMSSFNRMVIFSISNRYPSFVQYRPRSGHHCCNNHSDYVGMRTNSKSSLGLGGSFHGGG